MALTLLRQEDDIRQSDLFDDTIAPSEANFETNPVNLESDLNNIRSMLSHLLDVQAGNWYDVINTPSALESGSQRGVSDLNTDLHALEKKRRLRRVHLLVDISVPASQNYVVLGVGEIPTQTTAAVGAVTTLGTVVATHGGTFGTHDLAEVAGANALNPKNLLEIVDGAGDPILSSGRRIWGLLQGEGTLSDGGTITASGGAGDVQISFVRANAGFTDLEAAPVADIENATIRYCYVERVRNEDLNEQDYLSSAFVDIGAGAVAVTRQAAYDNQGATPVDLTTNAILDLEGAGLSWEIRDDAEARLFAAIDGSGGQGTVQIGSAADFDSDAGSNDFLNGASFDTGAAGTTINIGVTANQIDSGGALSVASGGGADLNLVAALELNMTDSYRAGSTWSLADGIALANSSAEWDAFEAEFGEVSLLNAMVQAKQTASFECVYANVTADAAADTDVGGTGGGANLDAQLPDMSDGSFVDDYDLYLNGRIMRPGADASANNDYYPGTSLALGQVRFERKVKIGDVIKVRKFV